MVIEIRGAVALILRGQITYFVAIPVRYFALNLFKESIM